MTQLHTEYTFSLDHWLMGGVVTLVMMSFTYELRKLGSVLTITPRAVTALNWRRSELEKGKECTAVVIVESYYPNIVTQIRYSYKTTATCFVIQDAMHVAYMLIKFLTYKE